MGNTGPRGVMGKSLDQARFELSRRLSSLRPEIEEAVLTRLSAIADADDVFHVEHADGLRAAVRVGIAYGIAAVERGENDASPFPATLLARARIAGRIGVPVATVLHQAVAGHTLFNDYLMSASRQGDRIDAGSLQRLMREQASLFERLLARIIEEHKCEADSLLVSSEQRRADRIRRLLAGELVDVTDFAYDFRAFHLALIARGHGADDALREFTGAFDHRLLMVRQDELTVWAWLGGRRKADPTELSHRASSTWPRRLALAIGEPGEGIAGWRFTHRQAAAALPVIRGHPNSFVRYRDVAFRASLLQDDLLSASLRKLYLAPLEAERDGGEVLRKTLRAYFAARRNVSSAASALGVSRQTVTNRLNTVERRLARPIQSCAAEMEAALHLEEQQIHMSSAVSLQ